MERMRKDFSSSFWSALRSVTQWIWCVAERDEKLTWESLSEKLSNFCTNSLSLSASMPPPCFFFCYHVFFQLISIIFSRTTKFKFLRIFHGKAIDIFPLFFSSSGIFTRFLGNVGNTKKNYFTIFLFSQKKRNNSVRNSRTEWNHNFRWLSDE